MSRSINSPYIKVDVSDYNSGAQVRAEDWKNLFASQNFHAAHKGARLFGWHWGQEKPYEPFNQFAVNNKDASNLTSDHKQVAIDTDPSTEEVHVVYEDGSKIIHEEPDGTQVTITSNDTVDTTNGSGIDLVVDDRGFIYAAWHSASNPGLWYSFRNNIGNWSSPEQVTSNQPKRPSVDTNEFGTIYIAYANADSSDALTLADKEGGSWSNTQLTSNSAPNKRLHVHDKGNIGIVFEDTTNSDTRVAIGDTNNGFTTNQVDSTAGTALDIDKKPFGGWLIANCDSTQVRVVEGSLGSWSVTDINSTEGNAGQFNALAHASHEANFICVSGASGGSNPWDAHVYSDRDGSWKEARIINTPGFGSDWSSHSNEQYWSITDGASGDNNKVTFRTGRQHRDVYEMTGIGYVQRSIENKGFRFRGYAYGKRYSITYGIYNANNRSQTFKNFSKNGKIGEITVSNNTSTKGWDSAETDIKPEFCTKDLTRSGNAAVHEIRVEDFQNNGGGTTSVHEVRLDEGVIRTNADLDLLRTINDTYTLRYSIPISDVQDSSQRQVYLLVLQGSSEATVNRMGVHKADGSTATNLKTRVKNVGGSVRVETNSNNESKSETIGGGNAVVFEIDNQTGSAVEAGGYVELDLTFQNTQPDFDRYPVPLTDLPTNSLKDTYLKHAPSDSNINYERFGVHKSDGGTDANLEIEIGPSSQDSTTANNADTTLNLSGAADNLFQLDNNDSNTQFTAGGYVDFEHQFDKLPVKTGKYKVPITTIGGNDSFQPYLIVLESGETLSISRIGVHDGAGNAGGNITLRVKELNGSTLVSTTNKFETVSASTSGAKTMAIEVENTNSSSKDIGGFVQLEIS